MNVYSETLSIVAGPNGSGKTGEVYKRVRQALQAGQSVLVISDPSAADQYHRRFLAEFGAINYAGMFHTLQPKDVLDLYRHLGSLVPGETTDSIFIDFKGMSVADLPVLGPLSSGKNLKITLALTIGTEQDRLALSEYSNLTTLP